MCKAIIHNGNHMNKKVLLTSSEAAEQLGISKTTIHRHVHAGKLECIQLAKNSIYFSQQQLDEFIDRHRKQYTPNHPRDVKSKV